MIEFRQATDGDAPDLISRLETLSGVPIRYAASVSPKRHTYLLHCPAGEPPCEAALHALSKDPAVVDISPDLLRKPFHTPP